MSTPNPLVAQAPAEPSGFFNAGTGDNGWATGFSIADSAVDAYKGISEGSWIEGGLGVVGLVADAASMAIDPFGTLLSSAASFLMEHMQPLKEALDWLAGDPPVIESYSTTWGNVSAELGKVAADYKAAVDQTASWSGAAGDAYRKAAGEQLDALSGAASTAGSVGTVVGVMGMVVGFVREMVRDLIADLVAKLITWVLEAVFTLGFGTPVIVAQAVTAISKWAARIGELIQKLIKTIKKVSPLLGRLVEIFTKIMKVVGKLVGKVTGLDVISTKSIKPGGLFHRTDSPDLSPSGGNGSPSSSSSSSSSSSPDSSSSSTPDSSSSSPSSSPDSSPSSSSPSSPSSSSPSSTPPSSTPDAPSPSRTPDSSSPSSAPSPSRTPDSASNPDTPSPSRTPDSSSPDAPSRTPDNASTASAPSAPRTPDSSPSSAPSSAPHTGGPSSTPDAPAPTRNTGQTVQSSVAPPEAPSRPDAPQAPTRTPDSTPSSTPTQQAPMGGGTPNAGGNAPSSPAAGRPQTGGQGWTGTPGSRGDLGSSAPAPRSPDLSTSASRADAPSRPTSMPPAPSSPSTPSAPSSGTPFGGAPSGGMPASGAPSGGAPHAPSAGAPRTDAPMRPQPSSPNAPHTPSAPSARTDAPQAPTRPNTAQGGPSAPHSPSAPSHGPNAPGNTSPSHNGPGNAGPSNTGPGHNGSPHNAPPHSGPSHTSPSQAGPSHGPNAPSNTGPSHNAPGNTSPSHNAPGNTSPSHSGPSNAGPSNTGPGHNAPPHSGPSHTSPSQAGPSHANPPHHGPGNTGPSHANPPHGNPAPGGAPHTNQPHSNQPNTGPQSRGPAPTSHPNAPHQPSSPHAPNRPFDGPPPQRHPDAQTPPPRHAPDSAPARHTPEPTPRQDSVPHQRSDQDPWSPPHDSDGPGTPDRPDIDDAHARHGETTPAGISHHRGDSDMGDLPQRVPHDPRYFTADVHVTPDGRARIGNHSYSPEEYGDLLRRNGWDGKTPIRLIGCDAGSNDFANRLSRHTGADVLAPTKPAWTDSNGRVYTSDAEVDPDGNRRPRIPPNGEWETHSPDGTRTRASDDGFAPGTNDADKHDLDPDDARDRGRDNTITDPPEGRDPTPQRTVPWDPPENLPRVDVEVDPNQRVLDFNGGPPLEPNSRVVVHHPDGSVRGTYYTDANRNVTHVDTSVSNTRDSSGALANPDVTRPERGVVYQVSTGTSTHTFQGQDPDVGTSRPDTTTGTTDTGTSPDTTPDVSPDHRPADRFDDFDQTRTPPAVEWNPPGGPDGNYRTMPPHENYNPAPPPDGDGPFSLRGNDPDNPLQPHARYDVYNDNGDWHGTFYTGADGRVSHVHTWSGNSAQGFNPELGTAQTWDAGLPVPAPNTTFAVGPRHMDGMDPQVPQQLYRTDVHGDTAAASGRPVYPPSGTRAEDFWGPRRGVEPGSPGEGVQPDTGRIASGGPEGYKSPTAGEYAPFNYYGNRHELFKFDGGHIVAFEAGGPGERINHVPQWAYENRPMRIDGGSTDDTWRRMEEDIARHAATDGTTVDRVDFWAERTTPDIHTPDRLHARYHLTVSDPPPPKTQLVIRSFENVPDPARNNRVVLPPPTP